VLELSVQPAMAATWLTSINLGLMPICDENVPGKVQGAGQHCSANGQHDGEMSLTPVVYQMPLSWPWGRPGWYASR
jgi:hypothetical protein